MMDQSKWDAYARLQSELDKAEQVNDRSWGLEAALNAIIDTGNNIVAPTNLETIVATAGRRERHRARLRRVNAIYFDDPPDEPARLEAWIQIGQIFRSLQQRDRQLVRGVATGMDYNSIANMVGGTAGALRLRMLRVRESLALLAG